jgi:methylenetetrahydrofolate dehydrogenase (NADP+)/methenyltetrahydrofolate cyclohydrolase
MIIFDGYAWAAEREAELRERVNQHVTNGGKRPFIQAILFREDTGSVLYTRLKREAAERVGIGYRVAEFSLHDPVDDVLTALRAANTDPTITGIIIQKP